MPTGRTAKNLAILIALYVAIVPNQCSICITYISGQTKKIVPDKKQHYDRLMPP